MKRVLSLSVVLLLAFVGTALADSTLTVGTTQGTVTYGVDSTAGLAQAFVMPWTGNVDRINASLWALDNTTFTLWLTDKIGAGTTASNVIAQQTFTTGSSQVDQQFWVNLNAILVGGQQYFIILSVDSGRGVNWWNGVGPTTGGTIPRSDLLTTDVASFAPASNFYTYGSTLAFQVYDSPVTDAPEPATMTLLAAGIAAGLFRRRKHQ